jgi:transcriptional regulator with XRE-family HTH domain
MSAGSIERYREWARHVEHDPRFLAEELKLAFADELVRLLEARGLKRTELAEKLGTNRGYVTRVLNTDYNLTIETMARIADALGARVSLHLHPKGTSVDWSEAPVERPTRVRSAKDNSCVSRDRRDVPVVADKPASRKR